MSTVAEAVHDCTARMGKGPLRNLLSAKRPCAHHCLRKQAACGNGVFAAVAGAFAARSAFAGTRRGTASFPSKVRQASTTLQSMTILQKTPADTVSALERASIRRTTPNPHGDVVW